jgi:hypothetical protein
MKARIFGVVMCLVLLGGAALPASAQTSRRYRNNEARYGRRYDDARRYSDGRRYRDDRSFWDEHRDKVTVAGGAGAGAVIGGIAGGKKGAIIGALLGAGGSALYTYKLRDRDNNRRYRRY